MVFIDCVILLGLLDYLRLGWGWRIGGIIMFIDFFFVFWFECFVWNKGCIIG